jgi:hypothetical protein
MSPSSSESLNLGKKPYRFLPSMVLFTHIVGIDGDAITGRYDQLPDPFLGHRLSDQNGVKFSLPNLDRKVDFISPETTRSTTWYSSAPAARMNKRLILDPRARCAFCSERVTEVSARISWS